MCFTTITPGLPRELVSLCADTLRGRRRNLTILSSTSSADASAPPDSFHVRAAARTVLPVAVNDATSSFHLPA
jgi:hypothetical protein